MRDLSLRVLIFGLAISVGSSAMEIETIDELRAHLPSIQSARNSYSAAYTMTDTTDPSVPITTIGEITVRDDAIHMTMTTVLSESEPEMNIEYEGAFDHNMIVYMLVKTPFSEVPPAMIDMDAVGKLAKKLKLPLNVPSAILGTGNPGAGLLMNPTKILESIEDTYDLKLIGRESLNDEEVFVLEASMNAETLNSYNKYSEIQGMFDVKQKIYIGTTDGVMRKIVSGDISMVLSNVDFDAKIEDEDFVLDLPEGKQWVDITEMMLEQYSYMSE